MGEGIRCVVVEELCPEPELAVLGFGVDCLSVSDTFAMSDAFSVSMES